MEVKYLWMSFADDKGFNGVIISDNLDIVESIKKAHMLKINPGGDVKGYEIPSSNINKAHLWRLMKKEELKKHGYIS